MEPPRKWSITIIVLLVVCLLLAATIGYLLIRTGEDEENRDIAVISISGPTLATSRLVNHGSGTSSDPYVVLGLDIKVKGSSQSTDTYGITITHVDAHLVISDVQIYADYVPFGHRAIGIGIWFSTNVTILGCTFENLSTAVDISHSVTNISYNTFERCSVGVYMERLEYATCPGMKIDGNRFANTDNGIVFPGNWDPPTWNDVTIEYNSMAYYQRAIGVYGGGYNFTVADNEFHYGTGFAVDTSMLSASIIVDNVIIDGGGISIAMSTDVVIENNSISAKGPSLSIESSSDIRASNNTINNYALGGSLIQIGVLVTNSWSVNVTYNKIWYCAVGVMLLSSGPGNMTAWIHHNEFAANFVQALDNSGSENHWDDGTGAGNYWDDYQGADGDSDGVGDVPYVIDSDSFDNSPLVLSPLE